MCDVAGRRQQTHILQDLFCCVLSSGYPTSAVVFRFPSTVQQLCRLHCCCGSSQKHPQLPILCPHPCRPCCCCCCWKLLWALRAVRLKRAKELEYSCTLTHAKLSVQSSMDSQRRDEVAAAAAAAQPLPMPMAPPPAAAWGFTGDAESFPSLGQMPDAPKRAPSVRGPAAATPSSVQDTQKSSQTGSAPKMGFANAVSGEHCNSARTETLICAVALCVTAGQQDGLWPR